mmetsp:Transcript_21897/g.44367  ORF Transcript_21897/g.44367 Transcript_21897/m.44367 type:complete len:110 (-) Transcript_21897:42-371(-)
MACGRPRSASGRLALVLGLGLLLLLVARPSSTGAATSSAFVAPGMHGAVSEPTSQKANGMTPVAAASIIAMAPAAAQAAEQVSTFELVYAGISLVVLLVIVAMGGADGD